MNMTGNDNGTRAFVDHDGAPHDEDSECMAQASAWFIRLRDEPVTEDVINAWSQWCEMNIRNARCYRAVQNIWSLAGDAGMAGWPAEEDIRADGYSPEVSISEWRRGEARIQNRKQRRRIPWPLGLAAALLLGIGTWQFTLYLTRLPDQGVYTSERAQKRDLRLADGSILTLGGASAVRVAYGEKRREVYLERGEAFFDVRKDRNRPFIVTAPNLRVTAIGTAFAVRADDTRTVVSVTEGLVEVERGQAHPPTATPVRARAGEQVTVDAQSVHPVLSMADEGAAIGWQNGAFVHVDEPLRSVVARINRYSPEEVTLGDPSLGKLRFTGTVFEHQVEEWVRGLERVFPVRTAHGADGGIALYWSHEHESGDPAVK